MGETGLRAAEGELGPVNNLVKLSIFLSLGEN
jgi:hypothetical protein